MYEICKHIQTYRNKAILSRGIANQRAKEKNLGRRTAGLYQLWKSRPSSPTFGLFYHSTLSTRTHGF